MGDVKVPCDWCGMRIVRGYHGDSKSIFMRNYRFYCSEECKKADSLPDWACFPAFIIPCTFYMLIFWINNGTFATSPLGTIAIIGLFLGVCVFPLSEIKGILKLRRAIPKDSRLE